MPSDSLTQVGSTIRRIGPNLRPRISLACVPVGLGTRLRLLLAVLLGVSLLASATQEGLAAGAPVLKRYPYLTDATSTSVLVNFATDTPSSTATPVVTWGVAGGTCNTNTVNANAGISITVGVTEYQYKGKISGLSPNTSYCYRINQNNSTPDLLGVDPSPTFTTAVSPGANTSYSYAVIGDFGAGTPEEANVLSQVAKSNASFIVTAGDNAYNGGSQSDYGDLTTGNVFAPAYWKQVGSKLPAFPAHGNHGFTTNLPYVQNWPEDSVVAASGGTQQQSPYCGVSPAPSCPGSTQYADTWYAFDWGVARYYVLEGAWSDSCGGAGPGYNCDAQAHFGSVAGCTPCGKELTWLQQDLAAHTSTPLKFAFWHYPLYSDNGGQPTDCYLNSQPAAACPSPPYTGSYNLEGLLANNNVDVVFNGHAHEYERNRPQVAGNPLVNYVTGGGGDPLTGGGCSSSYCAVSQGIFHYLLVTVNGAHITVTPIDQNGVTFDAQSYDDSATVNGTVTAASGGAPIAGAAVSGGGASTTTNGSGQYTLTNVLPGTPNVMVSATGFTTTTQAVTVGPTKTATSNFSLTAAANTGAVTGTVTSASGGAVISGATVTDSGGASAITNGSGVYTLGNLAAGSHSLTASATGFTTSQPQAATVTANTTTTLNFSLTPAATTGTVSGTVLNASGGAAITGATVSDSGGAHATTDSTGAYGLPGLSPGPHTLTSAANGFAPQQLTATVTANTTTTLSFSLTAAPTGTVTGTVTSASGAAAIAGATVIDSGGSSATTNSSGVYTLAGLTPASHTVTVSATGFISASQTATVSAGTTQTASFSLTPSATTGGVTGTVTSSSGGAIIAGATVTDSGGASTTTDSSGVYTLPGLTQGSHTLTATASGFSAQVQTASVTTGNTTQNVNFRLIPATTTGGVSGTVTNASGGAAIAGATVTDSVSSASTTTNAQGVYSFTGLVPGSHTLTASASGFTPAPGQATTIAAGLTQNLPFSLTPTPTTGAITGIVTNAAGGAPIAGATVSASGGGTTSTNASGIYTLTGLAVGSRSLTVTAAGFNPGAQTATVYAGQTTQGVNVGLIAPAAVGGTPQLVQTAGASETAAATSLTATFPTATTAGNLLVLSAGVWAGSSNHITSITDSGGNTWTNVGAYFAAGHFSDGEMWYSANAKSDTNVVIHVTTAAMAAISVQEFSGVATTTPLDVSLGASTTTASTAPSSGAVTPTAATDLMVGLIAGHNNAQAITVTPAIGYTAQAQQTSGTTGGASVVTGYKVLSAASAQTFSGSLTTAVFWASGIAAFKAGAGPTGAVSGTVTSASGGAPIPGATVSDPGGASTTTNSSGVYTLSGLAATSHTLTAAAAAFISGSQTVSVTAGVTLTGVNFVLTPSPTTGAVTGTVISSSSGSTIAGATVTDGGGATATTNNSGVYTLGGLAAVSHTLTASATGFITSAGQTASVTAGQVTQNVNFSLTPSATSGSVTGTVTNANGGAVISGATVTDSVSSASTTTAAGAYSLAGLALGSHTLTVTLANFISQSKTVVITAGIIQNASFSLTPTPTTGAVTGTVTSGGAPVAGATVTDIGGQFATTDVNGAFTLSGLAPGSHTLTATASGLNSQAQIAPVSAGATQVVSFTLTPTPTTGAVSGIVTSAAGGAPIPGATVSDTGGTATATTNPAGSYILTGLTPGSHTVTAIVTGFASQSQPATVTAGNSQTISFSLTPATLSSLAQSQAPQGNWVGSYGADGYALPTWTNAWTDLVSMPLSSMALDNGSRYQWSSSTTAVQALQSPDASTRRAATFYDPAQIRLHLTFTNAYSGTLHLYALDWDAVGRRETITVNDGSGPRTADISSAFDQGVWVNAPINVSAGGSVTISVTNTGAGNAVLSGIFLGGPAPAPLAQSQAPQGTGSAPTAPTAMPCRPGPMPGPTSSPYPSPAWPWITAAATSGAPRPPPSRPCRAPTPPPAAPPPSTTLPKSVST